MRPCRRNEAGQHRNGEHRQTQAQGRDDAGNIRVGNTPGRKNEGEIFFQRGLFRGCAVPPESGQPGTETGTELRQVLTGFTGESQNA